jgi:asparagine N-glycosylation enzyme membrane subunit Stt3
MVNWSAPAPANPEKPDWLHDQSQLPAAPSRSAGEYVRGFMPLILGLIFAAGFVALAFQTRASWGAHRDWVVPTTIPLTALGGVALGYLVARRAWLELTPGILLLLITITLTVLNIWRGAVTDGEDTLRDVLSITAAVFLGLTVLALWLAMAYLEARHPTLPPRPEM